ncbi:MAG: nitrous oxide reductase family maturation protein NosD [Deltaproteobacteria bacterium]|nr:nitrous oxide reductase family maturation protein NosD [Deltaproteobacteria bacterium]
MQLPLLSLVVLGAGSLLPFAGCHAQAAGEDSHGVGQFRVVPPPARPSSCTAVAAGTPLQPLLARLPAGAALCLADGQYRGPLRITRPVTLWGKRGAVIRSDGIEGTTIAVRAAGSKLLGFTVDGSGPRYDRMDAAVLIEADDVLVHGLNVVNALFGLLAHKCNRAVLRGNEVSGSTEGPIGMRGDGIRLWEVRDSLIEGNAMRNSRDLVIWYAPRNRILGNLVTHSRYGTHFMYSHDCDVEDNRFVDNVVGIFVMYSRKMTLRRNVLARGTGAAGMGLGLKEGGNIVAEDNLIVGNTVGLYVDTSPLQKHEHNRYARNTFRFSDVAVMFHTDSTQNTFEENTFADNDVQVQPQGGGDARGVTWRRNRFDDYQGYDLDGDGYGDVPYRLQSLSNELVGQYPNLAFLRGSMAIGMIDAASRLMPLYQPKVILEDPRPRTGPVRRTCRAN